MKFYQNPYTSRITAEQVMQIMERDNLWPTHDNIDPEDAETFQQTRRVLVNAMVREENRSRTAETEGVQQQKWNDREILPEARDDMIRMFLPPHMRDMEITIRFAGNDEPRKLPLASLPLDDESLGRMGIDLGEYKAPLAAAQQQFRDEDSAIHSGIQRALDESISQTVRQNRANILLTTTAGGLIALGALCGFRGCNKAPDAAQHDNNPPPAQVR